jgi:hypothetical protein
VGQSREMQQQRERDGKGEIDVQDILAMTQYTYRYNTRKFWLLRIPVILQIVQTPLL